jgi:hypothetical protein
MSGNSRGQSFGELASDAELNLCRRPASESMLIVLRVIFVGATAALFLAWLS